METIITAATVMAMYFNVSTSGNGDYYYNAEIENDRVLRMEVLEKNGSYLANKLQYTYVYDENNRLTGKTAMKWNALSHSWKNYYTLFFTYNDNGYIITRYNWDEHSMAYSTSKDMMVYERLGNGITAVKQYKWDNSKNDMAVVNSVLIMTADRNVLLAYAEEMNF